MPPLATPLMQALWIENFRKSSNNSRKSFYLAVCKVTSISIFWEYLVWLQVSLGTSLEVFSTGCVSSSKMLVQLSWIASILTAWVSMLRTLVSSWMSWVSKFRRAVSSSWIAWVSRLRRLVSSWIVSELRIVPLSCIAWVSRLRRLVSSWIVSELRIVPLSCTRSIFYKKQCKKWTSHVSYFHWNLLWFLFLSEKKNDSFCFLKFENFLVVVSYFLGKLRKTKVVNVKFCTYMTKLPLKSPISEINLLNWTIFSFVCFLIYIFKLDHIRNMFLSNFLSH